MINIVHGFGVILFSQFPREYPLVYAVSIISITSSAAILTWLMQVRDEWNPKTVKTWDKLFLGFHGVLFFFSAVMVGSVVWLEGLLTYASLISVAVFVATTEQLLNLFYPRLRILALFDAVVVLPFLLGLSFSPQIPLNVKAMSVLCLTFYGAVQAFRAYLKKLEFKERVRLKAMVEDEKNLIQSLLDVFPAKISWLDANSRYKVINRELLQYLQITPKAIIGNEFGYKQNPEFKLLNRKLKEFRDSNLTESLFEHPVKVGNETRRHQVILKKITCSEGIEIVMMTLDIEDLRKAQEFLKETGSINEPVEKKKAS